MPATHFEPPVLEIPGTPLDVDITVTPYFYSDNGTPSYVKELPPGVTPLAPVRSDPSLALGHEYAVTGVVGFKKTDSGDETELGFVTDGEVTYEPMWATPETAAAFGITLVQPGQAVQITSPVNPLQYIPYEYGVFAGHWSPYQEKGNRLLSYVITDLEHHDFPHIFASTDPKLPLVISVGRYWPHLGKIRLADLWVPRGSALYIPPKPQLLGMQCIDLHNNRNSARACWGHYEQESVQTHTLLQANNGFFYWYWNRKPTAHSNL